MCGYLISITKKNLNNILWENAFKSIKHRGPDNSRIKSFNNKSNKIKIGFHRLSIVDSKNEDANQPFITEKSILVFNGEIYNFLKLRKKLQKKNVKFKTKSDTEVLVRYLEIFGISKTLKDLDGMWSFAWFQKSNKKIVICRDRYGEKPLYYYNDDNQIIIASEIKAILILTNKKFKINKVAANNFLNLGIVDYNEQTLFSNIFQIPASTYSIINYENKFDFKFCKYFIYKKKKVNYKNTLKDNSHILSKKLRGSLISRLSNEVKMGILISGGIDSSINFSIIRDIMKKKKLNLFFSPSLNKNNKDNDSIKFLKNYFKLKVKTIKLPNNQKLIFKILNKIIWMNDYPVGNLAAVNQYLIGKNAKERKIKVLISGQGADEVFYGYLKYYSFYLINLVKNKKILTFIKNFFYLLNSSFFKQVRIFNSLKYLNLNFLDKKNFFNKKYLLIPRDFKNFEDLKKRSFDDMNKFSVPSICHAEDRMYMSSGIEVRFPYLNIDLQNFSLSLLNSSKLRYGYTKYILRQAFKDYLPKRILWRKDKVGFETGVEFFLKKNEKFLKKSIINHRSLILNEGIISNKFLDYFESYFSSSFFKKNYDPQFIFIVVSFELWLHKFKKYLVLNN